MFGQSVVNMKNEETEAGLQQWITFNNHMFALKQMFDIKKKLAHKQLFARKDQFEEYYTQTIKMRSLIIIQVYLIFI